MMEGYSIQHIIDVLCYGSIRIADIDVSSTFVEVNFDIRRSRYWYFRIMLLSWEKHSVCHEIVVSSETYAPLVRIYVFFRFGSAVPFFVRMILSAPVFRIFFDLIRMLIFSDHI